MRHAVGLSTAAAASPPLLPLVRRLRAEKAKATPFAVQVTTANATQATDVQVRWGGQAGCAQLSRHVFSRSLLAATCAGA